MQNACFNILYNLLFRLKAIYRQRSHDRIQKIYSTHHIISIYFIFAYYMTG